ncbi:10892_t:CDS:2, partial [Racocetra fulgida]
MIEEEGFLNVNVTKESEFEEVSSGDEVFQNDDDDNITQVARSDQSNFFSNEVTNSDVFCGKVFLSWDECDLIITEWLKKNGFRTKKDRVQFYYDATILQDKDLEECYTDDCETEIRDMTNVEIQQITLKQVIDFVGGLNSSQQKIVYGKLHGVYKKAIQKALQSKTKSQQLIELLQDFTEMCDEKSNEESEESEESEDESNDNKENHVLLNPK